MRLPAMKEAFAKRKKPPEPPKGAFRLTDADRATALANDWHLFEIRIEDTLGNPLWEGAGPLRPECSEELREMFSRWNSEGRF